MVVVSEIYDSINWGWRQSWMYKRLIKEQLKVKSSVLSADLRFTILQYSLNR